MYRILIIVIFLFSLIGYSQSNCTKYFANYIPIDLEDTFSFFKCNWSEKELEEFKNSKEKDAVVSLHSKYGMNIRNNWGLWKREGKLVGFFNKNGIYHPEDMSSVIFTSFHRKLNNMPIELKEQAKFYKSYWEEADKRLRSEYQLKFNRFQVRDTIGFRFFRGYVSLEQKEMIENKKCSAKAIVLRKRESGFFLKIKIIETCDDKGMYIIKTEGRGKKIVKKNDVEWVFINDWLPKN